MYIIYADIDQTVKIIQKKQNKNKQKQKNIFLADIQCRLFENLMKQRISIVYIVETIVSKRFVKF